eukprot:TRINITY_DN85236_c0_g1_i1.p1 TRINITY_DN85236_c0_g1~~TRINITY_DN85236_c0_g1_i1.p1  ORF type:complete len:239 (-),score=80.63 TRINITY_DN85236_c0_g1_i1:134-850(-)
MTDENSEQSSNKRPAEDAVLAEGTPPEKVQKTEDEKTKSDEDSKKSAAEALAAAKKKALEEAKRAALARLQEEEETSAKEESEGSAVADLNIVDYLKKHSETAVGQVLKGADMRTGVVASAPPVYVKREPKPELIASGDANAIVALAGPSQGKAPAIPGLANARMATKASGHWCWDGSSGGVAFDRPKLPPRPPLGQTGGKGAAAANLLVRPKQYHNQPPRPGLGFNAQAGGQGGQMS